MESTGSYGSKVRSRGNDDLRRARSHPRSLRVAEKRLELSIQLSVGYHLRRLVPFGATIRSDLPPAFDPEQGARAAEGRTQRRDAGPGFSNVSLAWRKLF